MRSLLLRVWLLLCAAAVAASCSDPGNVDPGSVGDDDDDDQDVGQQSQALAEGRTVPWTSCSGGECLPESKPRYYGYQSARDRLLHFCASSMPSALPSGLTSPAARNVTGRCDANATSLQVYEDAWSSDSFFSRVDAVASAYLCAGNLALQLADAAGDQYGVSRATGSYIENKPLPLVAGTSATLMRFPPRTASESATWALHATDFYRAAASLYVQAFNTCGATVLTGMVAQKRAGLPTPVQVPYAEVLASYLSESVSSVVEAAEKSKKYVAAAAQAKQSKGDPITNRVSVWLDRHDSRLEGASIFVPVHRGSYQPRLSPIYEMVNASGAYYYTANPENPRAGFARSLTNNNLTPPIGYGLTYDPTAAWPRFAGPLRTYTLNSNSAEMFSGANPGAGWTQVSTDADHAFVYTTAQAGVELIGYTLWQNGTATPKKYRWVRQGATLSGWSQVSPVKELYVFPYNSGSPEYPLVTTDVASEPVQRAVELMRTLRVDPRLGIVIGGVSRHQGMLRDDFAQALVEDYGEAYANKTTDEVIAMLDLTNKDVEAAARRLVQEVSALGRGLLDDTVRDGVPATESKRVWGLAEFSSPTHPGVIYARTAGRANGVAGVAEATPYQDPNPAYAATSVLATLDYVRDQFTDQNGLYNRTGLSAVANKTLKTAVQFAKGHLGPRTRVGYDSLAGTALPYVDGLRFYFQGLGYANTADGLTKAKADIDVWLGEAGLDCALRGSIEGQSCQHLKFSKTVPSGSADWSIDTTQNELVVRIYRAQAPSNNLRVDMPVFVTRKVSGQLTVLSAVYPDAPTSWDWQYLPPYGAWLAENLGDLLSVSAEDPADAEIDCVGLKTKLTLEDELTEGQTGKDGIESSYAHYLSAARQAADLADKLGEELVEQGLQMDMRAEAARDEVEDLCGGVINLDSIGDQACQKDCDILGALQESSSADNESLAACLGDPSESLISASFGSQPMCAFQVSGKSVCEGDYDHGALTGGRSMECPQVLPKGGACQDLFPVPSVPDAVKFVKLPALRMVPEIKPAPPPSTPDPTVCMELFKFAAGQPSNWKFPYIEADLKRQAQMFEVDYDPLGNPTVYLMGAPWLQIASVKNGQAPKVVGGKFPCSRFDGTHWRDPSKPDDPGFDVGWYCDASPDPDPLFCGLRCDGQSGTPSTDDFEHNRKQSARLVNAVATLRHMAGVPLKGVKYSIDSEDLSDQKAFFVRWYKPYFMWQYGDAAIPAEHQVQYPSNAGVLASLVELTSVVGKAWRGIHSENNDSYELVPELVGPSYGSTLMFGPDYNLQSGKVVFKGTLPMQGEARIYCDEQCFTFGGGYLENQFRDWYRPEYLGFGGRARIIVDMGDLMSGWLGKLSGKLPPTLWTQHLWEAALSNRTVPYPGYLTIPQAAPRKYYEGIAVAPLAFNDVMDALELACMGQFPPQESIPPCAELLSSPLQVAGLRDYAKVRRTLECQANELSTKASEAIVVDAPKTIIDAFESQSVASVFPSNQGEMAVAISDLMTALNESFSLSMSIGKIMRDSSFAVQSAESQIKVLGYQYDAAVEQAAAQIASSQTECTNAKIRAMPNFSVSYGNGAWGVSVDPVQAIEDGLIFKSTCANAAAQERSARAIQKITRNQTNEQTIGVLVSLQQTLYDLASQLDETHRGFLTAHAKVQASVARIKQIRNRASRAAARALLLDNDGLGHEFSVNTTMHARFNTLQARYRSALDDAKKLAYLARRALEQKVGMDMSKMSKDLQLVPAPKEWVNDLCSLSGVDYNNIRSSSGQGDAANDANGYAESYVGDYVRKLEMFLEAYRLAYPFQDADDLAVISVRDELVGAKAVCEEQGWNELLYTDGMAFGRPDRPDDSWEGTCSVVSGRRAEVQPGGPGPFQCAPAMPTGPDDSQFNLCNRLGAAQAMSLVSVAADTCSAQEMDGAVPQEPPLEGLGYWYAAGSCTETTPGSGVIASCTDLSGNGRNLSNGANLLTVGIGGQPTLSVTGTVTAPKLPSATDRYTVSYVVRPLGNATVKLWRTSDTQADATTREAILQYDSGLNLIFYMRPNTATLLPDSTTSAYTGTGGVPAALPAVGQIVTVRADGPNGVQLFVNGKRWTGTRLPAYAMKLGGVLAQGSVASPVLLAETAAYTRALPDAELEELHAYLADKYGIDTGAPDGWLEGDDLSRMRAGAGFVSPVSGFTGDATGVYDRVTGRAMTRAGGISALTTLGGHSAVDFDGTDDFLRWLPLGATCTKSDPSQTCVTQPRDMVDEYSMTIVARYANVAREHVLYWNGGMVRLVANGANGTVTLRVAKATGTETYSSPVGIVAPDVPFIVTMRASLSRNTTDVFVNGVKRASWPGFEFEGAERFLGRLSGDYLRGAIAEARMYARDLGDSRVNAIHAELGQKYGITVTALGEGGSVASAGAARIRQWAPVEQGASYMLSWYQPSADASLTPVLEAADGSNVSATAIAAVLPCTTITPTPTPAGCEPEMHKLWKRYFTTFVAPEGGWMAVGFPVPTAAGASRIVAAPQLERIVNNQSSRPSEFFPTDDDMLKPVGRCEDSNGDQFRTMWHRGCESYCPPGSGRSCQGSSESGLATRCYWELDFRLMLEDVERGVIIQEAGLGLGNFNYRHDEVAFNLVGTGLKDCELSEQPSACYANSHLSYSLRHDGPFRVRNHEGNVYRAPLFAGNIQQSNALVAERVMTNPISGSDRNLLQDFWDDELRGRPLDGNYSLRIYESDSLDWEKLEDVQMLLKYRYWTRFD